MAAQVSSRTKIITSLLLLFCFFHFFLSSMKFAFFFPSTCNTASLPRSEKCSLKFVKYVPSDMETSWTQNVQTWQQNNSFCEAQARQSENIIIWINTVKHLSTSKNDKLSSSDANFVLANKIFSKFVYTKICDSKVLETVEKWIEPLALSLRDPRFNEYCSPNGQQYLFSKDYLLLDNINGRETNHNFLVDLGAFTFKSTKGGASQEYFFDSYKARGIKFYRVLVWEGGKVNPSQLFQELPADWTDIYQFYNILPPSNKTTPLNPLNIIKKLSTVDDFVAYKLDIDDGPVENQFMLQLFEEEEVYRRVDEFFFEHHVFFDHMNRYWKRSINENLKLQDTYVLLAKLRSLGIRAHGWP